MAGKAILKPHFPLSLPALASRHFAGSRIN